MRVERNRELELRQCSESITFGIEFCSGSTIYTGITVPAIFNKACRFSQQ